MSADQRPLQNRDGTPVSTTERASIAADGRPTVRSGSTAERTDSTPETNASTLSTRLERCRLRVQVAALERALVDSERRRRSQIEQYERILQNRDATDGEERTPDGFVARAWRAVTGRGS